MQVLPSRYSHAMQSKSASEEDEQSSRPSSALVPPQFSPCLHPLHLLDQFLLQIKHDKQNNQSASNEMDVRDHDSINDKVLRITEFLYGKQSQGQSQQHHQQQANQKLRCGKRQRVPPSGRTAPNHASSGSILEGALELLDSFQHDEDTLTYNSRANAPEQHMQLEEEECQYEDYFNFNSHHDGSPEKAQERQIVRAPIRMIIAKESKRKIIVVRGSKGNRGGSGPSEYICTLGTSYSTGSGRGYQNNAERERGGGIIAAGRMGYHCSCRSFLERMKVDRFALCKHLLAARLAPFLFFQVGEDEDEGNLENTVVDGENHGVDAVAGESFSGSTLATSRIYQEEEVEEAEFGMIYSRLLMASW